MSNMFNSLTRCHLCPKCLLNSLKTVVCKERKFNLSRLHLAIQQTWDPSSELQTRCIHLQQHSRKFLSSKQKTYRVMSLFQQSIFLYLTQWYFVPYFNTLFLDLTPADIVICFFATIKTHHFKFIYFISIVKHFSSHDLFKSLSRNQDHDPCRVWTHDPDVVRQTPYPLGHCSHHSHLLIICKM